VRRERTDSGAFLVTPAPDLAIAAVAARQSGVVTLRQLEECGLDRGGIRYRIAAGRLQRLWRGVYSFGHSELTWEGRLIAAVFTCGPGAVLSHRSAADRWELLNSARAAIDVTVPVSGGRAQRTGIKVHRCRRLDPQEVTELNGILVTTPARTLVDLCSVVPPRLVERAYEQAEIRRLISVDAVVDAIERANGRRTSVLRRLVAAERRTATATRSELEERFLALVRRAGLPEPAVNARLHGYEVDFLWREQRRVVEVDGHAFHSTRQATTRDRRKDNDLELAGFRVTRFTADQVLHHPEDTLERTKRVLLGQ
jgi:very-short-patch-repair endonuclease